MESQQLERSTRSSNKVRIPMTTVEYGNHIPLSKAPELSVFDCPYTFFNFEMGELRICKVQKRVYPCFVQNGISSRIQRQLYHRSLSKRTHSHLFILNLFFCFEKYLSPHFCNFKLIITSLSRNKGLDRNS